MAFQRCGRCSTLRTYPLHIAIPAMMIGHLTFAGLAELIVSGGIVAYFQRTNPALLNHSAARISASGEIEPARQFPARSGWGIAGPLWIRLAVLMMLTPLGILVAGTAWGEWEHPGLFRSRDATRKLPRLQATSRLRSRVPRGLERWSAVWSAPFPQYAPAFVHRPAFGYVISAMFGSGLIMGFFSFLNWIVHWPGNKTEVAMSTKSRGPVERSLSTFVDALRRTFDAEELAKKKGLLQKLDPRIKIAAILPLILIAALARQLRAIVAIFVFAVLIGLLSRVPLITLAKRVWLATLTFTGLISIPALFLTPGRAIYVLPFFSWTITAQGLRAATYLIMRAETATTLSVLVILCTPWNNLLKALRVLRFPTILVVILGMTYRYILLLLRTAHDMFESRRSRMVGRLPAHELRKMATAVPEC